METCVIINCASLGCDEIIKRHRIELELSLTRVIKITALRFRSVGKVYFKNTVKLNVDGSATLTKTCVPFSVLDQEDSMNAKAFRSSALKIQF